MRHPKIVLPLFVLGVALLAAQPAYAHGFGDRYDLPVPLGYFLIGAGVSVALSFAIIGLFVRGSPERGGYWRYNLFRHTWARAVLTSPFLLAPLRIVPVFLLGLVIATGLFGSHMPALNFGPTFVWIIWWVGMGFVAALVGDLWAFVSPWKILFEWAEGVYRWLRPGGRLTLSAEYPPVLGIWPALVLFLLFAWIENAYWESSVPRMVAIMAIVYSGITLGGMVVFGKHRVDKTRGSLLRRFRLPSEVRPQRGQGQRAGPVPDV